MLDFTSPGKPAIGAVIPSASAAAGTTGAAAPASCMSYHSNGKRLFVAYEEDPKIRVIDCLAGKADRPAYRIEREQVHILEATHHEDCLLFAGIGNPTQPSGLRNAVNYLSVYDNKILRKFRGHSGRVTGLSQCPADDTFLSTSEDGTIRLWDLKSAGCLAECKLPSAETHVTSFTPPLAVFDSTGLVFGVAAQMSPDKGGFFLNLYDARNHSAGPFADLKINQADLVVAIQHAGASPVQAEQLSRNPWSNHGAFMKFNTKGDQILVGGNDGMVILLDGFGGAIQHVWMTGNSSSSSGTGNNNAVACFSSDDQCVLAAGSDPGTIDVFTSDKTGSKVKRLEGQHADGNITCIASNPVYSQFASSSMATALWIWDGVPR